MKLIKAVRGTKDIFGDEGIKYDYITRTAQEFFGNYGYSMIKTPIFEETDLFKRGVGAVSYTHLDVYKRQKKLKVLVQRQLYI